MTKSETKTYAAMALFALSLGCLTAVDAVAQAPSPLLGDWRAEDGSATARVAPCRAGPGLCATVVEERLEPGEPSALGKEIVTGVQPSRGAWTGLYDAGSRRLPARIRLLAPARIEMKVCLNPLLCETLRFQRVGTR